MNLLVTGGAGYIGSIVGAQLVEAGHQVTVLDNLSKGHRWAVPDGAGFIQGDLEDRALLHRVLVDAFDGVLHFAARSLVAESVEQPRQYYRNNLCGTLNLLDAMADAGVPRLVFSSTAAVYGHPEEVPISEAARPTDQPLRRLQARGRPAHRLCERGAWAGGGDPSLLQRRRSQRPPWRATTPRPTSSLSCSRWRPAAGTRSRCTAPTTRPATAPSATTSTSRISDERTCWPCRPPSRPAPDLQPGQRGRVLGPGGDRGGPGRHRAPDPEPGRPPAGRDPPILVASSHQIASELGWVPEKPELTTMIADAWAWMRASAPESAEWPS